VYLSQLSNLNWLRQNYNFRNQKEKTLSISASGTAIVGAGVTGSAGIFLTNPGTDANGVVNSKRRDFGAFGNLGYGYGFDVGWSGSAGNSNGGASSTRGGPSASVSLPTRPLSFGLEKQLDDRGNTTGTSVGIGGRIRFPLPGYKRSFGCSVGTKSGVEC
jgi:hypothetical protein